MNYPGYLLNPGDMFQVDVDRVMYATGRKKGNKLALGSQEPNTITSPESAQEVEAEAEAEAVAKAEAEAGDQDGLEAGSDAVREPEAELDEAAAKAKEIENLKALLARAKDILSDPSLDLNAKRKQALRAFAKDVRSAMSRVGRRNAELAQSASIVDDLSNMLKALEVSALSSSTDAEGARAGAEPNPNGANKNAPLTDEERGRLNELLRLEQENPFDPSKPYATPWRPRAYMAPFAFIPRYLEVNQNICAAVYLRHPVARQGIAEVPTPFPTEINQLAFNWYLRRR
jgi:hypothetical protein